MKQSTHPRLALNTCLCIFHALATSFVFFLMMSRVTGRPFFRLSNTNSNTSLSTSRCLPLRGPVNFFWDCLQANIASLCFHYKRTLLSGTENSHAACLFPSFSARTITLRLHLLCRRTCAACPFCCCTVISHSKLPYSPWHNE